MWEVGGLEKEAGLMRRRGPPTWGNVMGSKISGDLLGFLGFVYTDRTNGCIHTRYEESGKTKKCHHKFVKI